MFWASLGAMALLALFAVIWPLYRTEQRLSARTMAVFVLVAVGSGVLYQQIGRPDAMQIGPGTQTAAPGAADVESMVTSLAARLETNPGDIAGWKMLGRSYGVMGRYPEAIAAYEKAAALENSSNGQTLVDLGEAVFMNDNASLQNRAGDLFESAITLAPENPKAMFYSGLAAGERGNAMLAAERWEALLATGPPVEIESVLRQRIAEWRGEPQAPAAAVASAPAPGIALDISVALAPSAVVNPEASVFVIARDPAQPSPPIAVARRKANELPIQITMTDSDAMIPGRLLSGFSNLEIIARVSASGRPIAEAGDWFGSVEIDTASQRELSIVVDRQVP